MTTNDLVQRKDDYSFVEFLSLMLAFAIVVSIVVGVLLKWDLIVDMSLFFAILVGLIHNKFYFRKLGELQIRQPAYYWRPLLVFVVSVLIITYKIVSYGFDAHLVIYIINFLFSVFLIYNPLLHQNRDLSSENKSENNYKIPISGFILVSFVVFLSIAFIPEIISMLV